MRRVGSVVGVAQNTIVVRCGDQSFPKVGTNLFDESLTEVGSVVEIFGPVDQPYLAVNPKQGRQPAEFLDEPVYAR